MKTYTLTDEEKNTLKSGLGSKSTGLKTYTLTDEENQIFKQNKKDNVYKKYNALVDNYQKQLSAPRATDYGVKAAADRKKSEVSSLLSDFKANEAEYKSYLSDDEYSELIKGLEDMESGAESVSTLADTRRKAVAAYGGETQFRQAVKEAQKAEEENKYIESLGVGLDSSSTYGDYEKVLKENSPVTGEGKLNAADINRLLQKEGSRGVIETMTADELEAKAKKGDTEYKAEKENRYNNFSESDDYEKLQWLTQYNSFEAQGNTHTEKENKTAEEYRKYLADTWGITDVFGDIEKQVTESTPKDSKLAYRDENGNGVTWANLMYYETYKEVLNSLASPKDEKTKKARELFDKYYDDYAEIADNPEAALAGELKQFNAPSEEFKALTGLSFSDLKYYYDMKADKAAYSEGQSKMLESIENLPKFARILAYIGAGISSIPASALGVLEYAGDVITGVPHTDEGDKSSYRPINTYDNTISNYASDVVSASSQSIDKYLEAEGVSQGWREFLTNTYSGVVSGLNSTAVIVGSCAIAGPEAGPILATMILSGEAGAPALREATERGATSGEALAYSAANVFAEYVTEKVSIGNLVDNVLSSNWDSSSVKSFLKSGLKNFPKILGQGAVEGSEEFLSDVITTVADRLIMGERDGINSEIALLISQGYSEKEAKEKAGREWLKDAAYQVYGGFIGGLMSGFGGGFAAGTETLGNKLSANRESKAIGNAIMGTDVADNVISIAAEDGSADTQKLIEKATADIPEGKGVIGKLISKVKATAQSKALGELTAKVIENEKSNAVKVAEGYFEGEGNSKALAELTASIAVGEADIDMVYKFVDAGILDEGTAAKVEEALRGVADTTKIPEVKKLIYSLSSAGDNKSGSGSITAVYTTEAGERVNVIAPEVCEIDRDGNVYVNVDGEKISTEELEFDSTADRKVFNMMEGLSVDGANALLSAYEEARSTGQSFSSEVFASEFKTGYLMGLAGLSVNSKGFNASEFTYKAAALAGVSRGFKEKSIADQKRVSENKKSTREGTASTSEVKDKSKLKEEYLTVAKAFNTAGLSVEFFEDADADYYGSYNAKSKTMRLNVDAWATHGSDAVLSWTIAHESVHYIADVNPSGYNEMVSFVKEKLGNKFDFYVRQQMKENGLSYTDAVEEVVCESFDDCFGNSVSLGKFIYEHESVAKQFIKKVREFISKLLEAMGRLTVSARSEVSQAVKYCQEKQQLYNDALTGALDAGQENISAVETENGKTDEVVKKQKKRGENFREDKYFQRQIDNIDGLKAGGYITVGEIVSDSPINQVGIPTGKLYFDVSKVTQEMKLRGDPISPEKMKEIPSVLDNPIVITEYVDKNNNHSVNVYGKIYVGNSPVVIGIMLAKSNKGTYVNKVQTVHPNRNFMNDMSDDKVLYLSENKKETKSWFQTLGAHKPPLGGNRFGFIRSITQDISESQEKFQKKPVKSAAEEIGRMIDLKKSQVEKTSRILTVFDDTVANMKKGFNLDAYIQTVASEIVPDVKSTVDNESREILKALKKYSVYLTDAQKAEAKARDGSYAKFRQRMMGTLNIVSKESGDGIALDSVIPELAELFPGTFPTDLTEGDCVTFIDDLVASLKKEGPNESYYLDIAAVSDFLARRAISIMNGEFKNSVIAASSAAKDIAKLIQVKQSSKVLQLIEREISKFDVTSYAEIVKNNISPDDILSIARVSSSLIIDDVSKASGADTDADIKSRVMKQVTNYLVSRAYAIKSFGTPYSSYTENGLIKALTDIATTEKELRSLQEYKNEYGKLQYLREQERLLKEKIYNLTFSDNQNEKNSLPKLKEKAADISKKIQTIEENLLKLEGTEVFRDLLMRNAKEVRANVKDEYRRAAQKKAVTEERNKLLKVRDELVTMLDKPRKSKYVPKSMIKSVTAIIQSIDTRRVDVEARLESYDRQIEKLNSKIKAASDEAQRLRYSDEKLDIERKRDDLIRREDDFQRSLAEFAAKYGELKNAEGETRLAFDERVAEMVSDMAKIRKPLYDMTVEELQTVTRALRTVKHAIKTAADMIDTKVEGFEGEDVVSIGKKMIEEVRSRNKHEKTDVKGEVGPEIRKARWNLFNSITSPRLVFEYIGNYTKNGFWEKVYQMLNEAQLKTTTISVEATRIFEDIVNDGEFKKLISTKKKDLVDIGFKDEYGRPVLLTRGMMLSVYMDLLNEDNMKHFLVGGYKVPNIETLYKGDVSKAYSKGVRITGISSELSDLYKAMDNINNELEKAEIDGDAELIAKLVKQKEGYMTAATEAYAKAAAYGNELRSRIYSQLTDYEKKYIKTAQYFFDEYSKGKINETTLKVYGFEKARVKNYYPIITDPNFLRVKANEGVAFDYSLENVGMMRDRVNASNPLLLKDFSSVISMQINRVSSYCGMLPAIKNYNKIFSYTDKGFRDSITDALTAAFGDKAQTYLNNFIADLQGVSKEGIKFLNAIRGNLAASTLTLNPRVTLLQMASYPTAGSVIKGKYLAKALAVGGKNGWAFSSADRELIAKWSPLLYLREKGFRSVDMQHITDGSLWKLCGEKLKFLNGWINFADSATVGRLWYAAEYQVQGEKPSLKVGSDAYYEEVARLYNRCIEETQPNYTVAQRPELLRTNDNLVKCIAMFCTQRLQNLSLMVEGGSRYAKYLNDYKQGLNGVTASDVKAARSQFYSTLAWQFTATAMIAGIKVLADALMTGLKDYRDDEDEITAESVLLGVGDTFLSTVIGNIPLAGDIYTLVRDLITGDKYYGMSLTGVSGISDAFELAYDLLSRGEMDKKAWEKLCRQVGVFIGLPVRNAEQIAHGIINFIKDIYNGEAFTFNAANETKSSNASKLYRYTARGDTERLSELTEGMTSEEIEELTAVGLKSNEDDITEAVTDRLSGKMKSYNKIIEGLKEDGFCERGIYKAVNDIMSKVNEKAVEAATAKAAGDTATYQKALDKMLDMGFGKRFCEGLIASSEPKDEDNTAEYYGMYEGADFFAAMEGGDSKSAYGMIDTMVTERAQYLETYKGYSMDAAYKKAKSECKSQITSQYKALYCNSDDKEKARIKKALLKISYDGVGLYKEKDIEGWG